MRCGVRPVSRVVPAGTPTHHRRSSSGRSRKKTADVYAFGIHVASPHPRYASATSTRLPVHEGRAVAFRPSISATACADLMQPSRRCWAHDPETGPRSPKSFAGLKDDHDVGLVRSIADSVRALFNMAPLLSATDSDYAVPHARAAGSDRQPCASA
jgi:hypothetical protein